MVDPVLRPGVDTLPNPMRHIASYHFGWLHHLRLAGLHATSTAELDALAHLVTRRDF